MRRAHATQRRLTVREVTAARHLVGTPVAQPRPPVALPIFLSAFLLFQIQPMISKFLLPWFGGSAAVWITAMIFFQALLFAGYGYAHLSTQLLSPRGQCRLHLCLMAAVVLTLPIVPSDSWKPITSTNPSSQILMILTVCIGGPFLVVASTAPLLQNWIGRCRGSSGPYHLYALSNTGSLIALLGYPLVVEPQLPLRLQMWIWSGTFVVFVICCARTTLAAARLAVPAPAADQERLDTAAPTPSRVALWVGLSASSVVMLMAVTNHLCLDVGQVPMLWILPLAVYLVSYMITFGAPQMYHRGVFAVLFILSAGTLFFVTPLKPMLFDDRLPLIAQVLVCALALFVICMTCHGELYRLRPPTRHLTRYYLSGSFGGLLGGIAVGLIAPRVFQAYTELPVGLLATALLIMVCHAYTAEGTFRRRRCIGLGLGWAACCVVCAIQTQTQFKNCLELRRNFYGLLTVSSKGRDQLRSLNHGSTLHGFQIIGGSGNVPVGYYARGTGIGELLTHLEVPTGRRIGVVGLGTGTLVSYGTPIDHFTFYELDPDVLDLARVHFTYLDEAETDWEVRLGDARRTMSREAPQNYHVLILDAFSSDSIPTHLLTSEAFELYLKHLAPGGMLCVHISNRYLDLASVVFKLAEHHDLSAFGIQNDRSQKALRIDSTWILMSRAGIGEGTPPAETFRKLLYDGTRKLRKEGHMVFLRPDRRHLADYTLWTDDYSSLLEVIDPAADGRAMATYRTP